MFANLKFKELKFFRNCMLKESVEPFGHFIYNNNLIRTHEFFFIITNSKISNIHKRCVSNNIQWNASLHVMQIFCNITLRERAIIKNVINIVFRFAFKLREL